MIQVGMICEINSARIFMTHFLKRAIEVGADDTFIITNFSPSFKIDGSVTPQFNERLTGEQTRLLVYAIMNEHQRKIYEAEKECNFAIAIGNDGRFRVNA